MKREYLRWYSHRLHRDMELLIFGHAGAKVLMFPTRDGRFFEYEELGIVASLSESWRPATSSFIVSRVWHGKVFTRATTIQPSVCAVMQHLKPTFSMKCCR